PPELLLAEYALGHLSESVSARWEELQTRVREILAQHQEFGPGEGQSHEEMVGAFKQAKTRFGQEENVPLALVVAELLMNDKFAKATDEQERDSFLVEASLALES